MWAACLLGWAATVVISLLVLGVAMVRAPVVPPHRTGDKPWET